MKVDYISDLHVDFWVKETNPQSPKFKKQLSEYIDMIIPDKEIVGTVLIIAGDLGHYNQQDQELLLELKKYYKYVMLVRGNHDMYLVSNGIKKKYHYNSQNRYLEMKRWCYDNYIIYLDGNVISLDGYNFAGVGMSWDSSFYCNLEDKKVSEYEIKEFFINTMNDANLILSGSDVIDIPTAYGGKYRKISFDPFEYFEKEYLKLQKINDFDNIDVMISHYVPTNPYFYQYQKHSYTNELTTTFYMFDGEKDIGRIQPKYWIFGHMHKNYNFKHKDVNFLCNPLGYPGENTYNIVKSFEL